MELSVAAAAGSAVPTSCYVGVRMGDVLKQGRYDPQRCYHFPAIDRRRNAKIDIYKHVGSCVIAADPDGKSSHEVKVASSDPTVPEIKLNVNVKSAPGADAGKQAREARTKQVKNQAQDYLTSYNIEEKLSLAVKALLKEQPAEPMEFLCRFLKTSGESLPTSPVARTPMSRAMLLPTCKTILSAGKFAEYYQANALPGVTADGMNAIFMKFPAAVAAAAKGKASAGKLPACKALLNQGKFAEYYKANGLPAVAAPALDSLYAKFPANRDAAAKAAAPASKPSCATLLTKGKFADYCQANTLPCVPAPCLNSIYMKFPSAASHLQPTKSSKDVVKDAPKGSSDAKANDAKAKQGNFAKTPSVGTWLATPCKLKMDTPYNKLASVGTWLAAAPYKDEPFDRKPDFRKLASVGTWLERAPPVQ